MKTLQHGDLFQISGNTERAYTTFKTSVLSALLAEWSAQSAKFGREPYTLEGRADYPFANPLPTVITAWREPAPVIAATLSLGEEVAFEGLTGTYTLRPEHNGHVRFESTDPALAAQQKADREAEYRRMVSAPGYERFMSE